MFGLSLEILRHRERTEIPVLVTKIIKRVQRINIDYTYKLTKEEYTHVYSIILTLKRSAPNFESYNANICIEVLRKFIESIPMESVVSNPQFQLVILNLIKTTNIGILSEEKIDHDVIAFHSMYPRGYGVYLSQFYQENSTTEVSPLRIEDSLFHFPTKLTDLRINTKNKSVGATNGREGVGATNGRDNTARRGGVKILCLDGGGMCGLFTIKMLEYICIKLYGNANNESTKLFVNSFDLIAGTSVGSIIGLALIAGYSIPQVRDLFYELGKDIFDNSYLKIPLNWINYLRNGDYYNHIKLTSFIENIVGPKRMSELKTPVVAVSTLATNNVLVPYLFKSYDDIGGPYESTSEVSQSNAVRASTAATTYFSPYTFLGNRYIDGGFTANNPTEIAIFESYNLFPGMHIELILSLGTGRLPVIKSGGGIIGISDQILNMVTNSDDIHIRVLEWLSVNGNTSNYFRFSPENLGSIKLDTNDEVILKNGEIITERYMKSENDQVEKLVGNLKVI